MSDTAREAGVEPQVVLKDEFAVLLFNYWASYQLLSTLVYAGVVAALFGLANLALPFRFLGIGKRVVGAIVLAGGVGLAMAALLWPASTVRVAQSRTRRDDIMPECQFYERHSTRVHARPEQVLLIGALGGKAMSSGTCPDCKGKGWLEMKCLTEGEARICLHCIGSGLTPSGLTPLEKDCPSCHGSGQIDIRTVEQQKCAKCCGTGRYPPPESL